MTAGCADLPTVSLAPFIGDCGGCVAGNDPTPGQRLAAGSIDRAFREHGFLYLTDLGVDEEDVRGVFDMMKRLFALSDGEKARLSEYDPKTNIGFSKFATEALNTHRRPDLKESFNIRSRRHYANDYTGTPDGFGDVAESLWDKLEEASRRLFIACALAMGEDIRFFERTFERFDFTTLRMLHFPPVEDSPPGGLPAGDGDALRIGEHTDFGMVTLLFHDDESAGAGLQVRRAGEGAGNDASGASSGNEEGSWVDAAGRGGATAIVNTGALLARWTNDEWRATAHRVVVPPGPAAGEDRYSLAYFLDPDRDAVVETHPRFSDAAARYKPITSGAFVQMKIEEMMKVRQNAAN